MVLTDWAEPTQCAICGHTDRRDLVYRLAHWLEAEPGMAYEHSEACADRAACRTRVEATGESWPLAESKEGAGAA